jgi:hypothetical protein
MVLEKLQKTWMYEYTVLPSMHADPKSITFTAAAVLAL